MSSRQEEKERRRQERMELEQAEARKAAAKRRMQIVFGALLGVAAIAAVAAALLAGGSDDDGGNASTSADAPNVTLPKRAIADLGQAAKAAGCELKENQPSEGRTHIDDKESYKKYKTNPPTSGTHRQTPAQDGIYAAGSEPDAENLVHTLEHGRVIMWFKPKTPKAVTDKLEALWFEPLRGAEGYHQVVAQNNTGMKYEVAASAWTHFVGCPKYNDEVIDVLRAFREKYVDKGPELVA